MTTVYAIYFDNGESYEDNERGIDENHIYSNEEDAKTALKEFDKFKPDLTEEEFYLDKDEVSFYTTYEKYLQGEKENFEYDQKYSYWIKPLTVK